MMLTLSINGPNRPLVTDDIPRLKAMGVRDILILSDFLDQVDALTAAGFRVHVRVNRRGPLGDPSIEATDLYLVQRVYPEVVSWRWRNEPNNPVEGTNTNPGAWAVFCKQFASAYVVNGGDPAKLWLAALSPSIGLDAWLGALVGYVDQYAGLDVHAYGNPGEVAAVIAAYHTRFDGRPFTISEYNFGAGRAYDLNQYATEIPIICTAAYREGIQGPFLFIWEWQTPDSALQTTVNIKDTPVETALARTFGRGATMDPSTISALVGKTEQDVINLLGQPEALDNMRGDGLDYMEYFSALPAEEVEVVVNSGTVQAVNFNPPLGGTPVATNPPTDPQIKQVLDQNSLITEALKAFRLGKFEGADGMDGYITALQGGTPFVGTYPPKAPTS